MRSAGFRYLVVGLLTLLMTIPLFLAGAVIGDRKSYANSTRAEIGREWGGPQYLSGPVLHIPVEGDVIRQERRERTGPDGQVVVETVPIRERGPVTPVQLMPDSLSINLVTSTQIRSRGIFDVPVYTAAVTMDARFDPSRLAAALGQGEVAQWHEAELRLGLGSNAGLRGEAVIAGPDGPLALEPYRAGHGSGIAARGLLTSDPRPSTRAPTEPLQIEARLTLNGTERLMVSPMGRATTVEITGDWPDPGFSGAFLPDSRTVTETGYSARWVIPHLAGTLPQVSRADSFEAGAFAFGTEFVQVNDFYQKAFRAARYGILFIALTFLTVLLIEPRDRPTHPVQYVLIGLAQAIFVLLMVAYAEQVGFPLAYGGSALATIGLLMLFGATALRLGRRTLVLGALLVVLYAVLYLILRSTDLALLAGATLAFGALALTMVLTRNEGWYGATGPGMGLRRTPRTTPPAGPWTGSAGDARGRVRHPDPDPSPPSP